MEFAFFEAPFLLRFFQLIFRQGSDSEEEDLSVGVQTFFQNVEKRRERRHRAVNGIVDPEDVGIENRSFMECDYNVER